MHKRCKTLCSGAPRRVVMNEGRPIAIKMNCSRRTAHIDCLLASPSSSFPSFRLVHSAEMVSINLRRPKSGFHLLSEHHHHHPPSPSTPKNKSKRKHFAGIDSLPFGYCHAIPFLAVAECHVHPLNAKTCFLGFGTVFRKSQTCFSIRYSFIQSPAATLFPFRKESLARTIAVRVVAHSHQPLSVARRRPTKTQWQNGISGASSAIAQCTRRFAFNFWFRFQFLTCALVVVVVVGVGVATQSSPLRQT